MTSTEKRWYESKKFLALLVVLGVVLVIAVLGIVFHAAIADLVGKIIAFATAHQVSQGTIDAVGQWKNKAVEVASKVEEVADQLVASFDPKDFDPEAFA